MVKFKIYVSRNKSTDDTVAPIGDGLHPVEQVLLVKKLIDTFRYGAFNTSSPDIVSAFKYLTKEGETEFFLDEVSTGTDVEPLFKSFNEAYDLINQFNINKD